MVEARRHGRLVGLAGDLTLRPGERLPLADVAAAAGMSPARIERIRLAAGFPPVDPDERLFSREDATTFASLATGDAFFGEHAMLHFVRVFGSSLARIAETAVALFLTNVEAPIVERQAGELALAQANLQAIRALDTIPNGVRSIFPAHIETAIRPLPAARPARVMLDTVRVPIGFA